MSGLVVAIRYLTILPLPGHGDGLVRPDRLGRAAPWFPVAGLALGSVLVAVDTLATHVFVPLLSAVLTVSAWKLLTGGLHLDGVADCLDGLMGRDREHRLAIMRDSRVGTFGAAGLALLLLGEIAGLAEIPPPVRWRVLLAAPTIARAAPPALARLLVPARAEGQGAAFMATVGGLAAPLAVAVALIAAVATLGSAGLAAAALSLLAAAGSAWFVARRIGGVTGDVLGAAVEVAELTVILTVTAWLGARH